MLSKPLYFDVDFDVENAIKALKLAGWKRYRNMMTVWESPKGNLFRGPALAYKIMRQKVDV